MCKGNAGFNIDQKGILFKINIINMKNYLTNFSDIVFFIKLFNVIDDFYKNTLYGRIKHYER